MEETKPIAALAAALMLCAACSPAGSALIVQPLDTGLQGHPLVPEEYTYYWNTRGCTTGDGSAGAQLYWLAEQGSADANGALSVTERWFWFFGADDYGGDCVDSFQIAGTVDLETRTEDLGCGSCDAAWSVTHSLQTDRCGGLNYDDLLGAPADSEWTSHLALDAVAESGSPNAENAMLVVQATAAASGGWSVQADYALGHAFPEGSTTWPATIDWLGSTCVPIP